MRTASRMILPLARRMTWLTLVLIGSAISAGCSPVYKVEYAYQDAPNPQVQACVLECGERRLSCKESSYRDYQYCVEDLRREEFRYRHCVGSAADSRDRLPLCTRPLDFCFRPAYSECTEDYAGCYERCGGTGLCEGAVVTNITAKARQCDEHFWRIGDDIAELPVASSSRGHGEHRDGIYAGNSSQVGVVETST